MIESPGQRAIVRLRNIFASHLGKFVALAEAEGSITATPLRPNTFPVTLIDAESEVTVYACGWHGHFEDSERAVNCFMYLLTPYTRIVDAYLGDRLCASHAEMYDGRTWNRIGDQVYPFEVFNNTSEWRSKLFDLKIYQQAVIAGDAPVPTSGAPEYDAEGLPLDSHLGVRDVPNASYAFPF